MAEENVYKGLMRARVLGALEMARAAKAITHSVVKGRITEILVSELFRPLLPADLNVASGQIVDHTGQLSSQQDVILFDASIIPPFSFDPSAAIIPIEAVLYTVEVKAKLTLEELTKAHQSAAMLASFKYLPSYPNNVPTYDFPKLNSIVFALSSDLVGNWMDEPLRYKRLYGENPPELKCICVAGKGYWTLEPDGAWAQMGGDGLGEEVLTMIGGVMNSYKKIAVERVPQKMGHYVISPSKDMSRFLPGARPVVFVACNSCGQHGRHALNPGSPERQDWSGGANVSDCACGGTFMAEPGIYVLRDGVYQRES